MPSLSPVLRNLDIHTEKFSLERIPEQWEILEAYDSDIVWNIVMAYLNYYPREGTELDGRLKDLGVEQVDKKVKGCVTRYNPFLKQNAYNCEKITELVVKPFKEKIGKFNNDYSDGSAIFDFNSCLETCSTLLSINILLVKKTIADGTESETAELFPTVSCFKFLVIFAESSTCDNEERNIFSFGMAKEFGCIKQRIVLRDIIKKMEFSGKETADEIMPKIMRSDKIQEEFLISLVKNESTSKYILDFYKSPYILTKLQDAGFETNPCAKNSDGKSALYFALKTSKASLLYFLYDYAANGCFVTDSSVRMPNEVIIENLKTLKCHLLSIKAEINQDNQANSHPKKLEEIIRLNEFQIDICSNIYKISQEYSIKENASQLENTNEEDSDNSSIFNISIDSEAKIKRIQMSKLKAEARLRQQVIISILKTYQKYIDWTNPKSASSFFAVFKKFDDNYDYYDNIDFYSTVLFFDNFFLLKDRLRLPDTLYQEIESEFFFFIYSKKYLIECEKANVIPYPDLSKLVLKRMRSSLKKRIRCFQNNLESAVINDENISKCVPKSSVQTLTNLPLIYDEFIIKRLAKSLEIATEMKIKNNDVSCIFVIERTLQIIGECVTKTKPGVKSVKKIIQLILPENLKHHFIFIRDQFSHAKPNIIEYRKIAEKDLDMFKGIQMELEYLKNYCFPIIFIAHKYTIDLYFLLLILNIVKEIQNIHHLNNEKEIKFAKWNFDSFYSTLEERIADNNEEIRRKLNNICFDTILETLFLSIERELSKDDFKRSADSDKILIINDYFWCVEFVLQLIVMDEKLVKYHKQITEKIIERKKIEENEYFQFLCQAKLVFEDYKQISKEILDILNKPTVDSNHKRNIDDDSIDFKNIEKLANILNKKPLLTSIERKQLRKYKPAYDDISFAKKRVQSYLKNSNELTDDELKKELSLLNISNKKQKKFNRYLQNDEKTECLQIIEQVPNYSDEFEKAITKCEIDKKCCENLCRVVNMNSDTEFLLKRLVKGQNKIISGNITNFLLDRIIILRKILIDENKEMKQLWEKAINPKTKDYLVERISEKYLNDDKFQAAVDTLLTDCMTVLHERKLDHLLKKKSNLFSGINLRNVLAHGTPLLEIVGKLVDPSDLPTELVRNVIRFISDENTIKTLVHLAKELKSDHSYFLRVLEGKCEGHISNEAQLYCTEINKCPHWKDYAKILKYDSN